MSGISGAWNLAGRPLDSHVLSGMSARLHHRGLDGERARIDGAVGFACQHFWVVPEDHGAYQPTVGESGTMLVMDGRLDNRAELVSTLQLDRSVSDSQCALSAYEKWSAAFAERLNGDFAIAVFDPRLQRLLLARDVMGVRPLYYFHTRHLFAFGSEIKALLAHPDITPRPDHEGVADFMLIGSRPLQRQDMTCFEGIASVVPAHIITVTADGLARRRYWDFDTERRLHYRIGLESDPASKTVFFQETFEQGRYEFAYLVKVIAPGQFRAVPAQISPMYVPGVHASSEPQAFTITAPGPGATR